LQLKWVIDAQHKEKVFQNSNTKITLLITIYHYHK